ncbi:twitching motility protein PilJ [Chitinivorax tropicus]|uniref:Twitching motility protein PilJ n=1 Tax=Chitinivorax tropicus TaxID=714531 RepID=A0A840MMR5_9PROT|nr:methyl-accepting chemotaxis protein [Chitinivorax tropicus]MBB5018022.1 twitching motility protein PilJ [Chitinivorax tropicus]
MAFSIKNLFGKLIGRGGDGSGDRPFDPSKTVSIIEKLRTTTDSDMPAPLPLIGHLPAKQQSTIFTTGIVVCLVCAGALVLWDIRTSNHNSLRRATSTEMQMLSQRMARAAAQAIQGNEGAFGTLNEAYGSFGKDLARLRDGDDDLPKSSGEAADVLRAIDKVWKESFLPNSVKPTVETILKNQSTIVTVTKSVTSINSNDAKLLEATQQLVSLLKEGGGTEHERELAQQMVVLTQRMAKNANAMLASEIINPEVVFLLGKDANTFRDTLQGMLDGSEELRLAAVKNQETREKLEEIKTLFKDFETVVSTFSRNQQNLVNTRLANQTIFSESEKLLVDSRKLANAYQTEGGSGIIYALIALFGIGAVGSLVMLGSVNAADAQRRRLESERENKRNQEAILRLLNEMSDLADGDLTVRASVTEDLTGAIADSMNYTIDELRSLITGINKATEQVTSAAAQAQSISNELLDAAQRQSTEIVTTNNRVQQMAQSISDVASTASESARVAEQSLQAAEKGTQAVDNSIKGMNEIREQIQETAKRIKRLGESSQEIGEIVELISDITEQTNVLALNAAIQAASAGEAGRGFTVVAEEVQRLAERSAEATKQIGAIVKTIQSDTHDAVAAMEVSTQGVVEGAKLSDAAGQALLEIRQVSRDLASLIQRISGATQEQSKMAEDVSHSMTDILNITEQTTAGTKQTAVQIGQLTGLAAELKGSVAGFKLS